MSFAFAQIKPSGSLAQILNSRNEVVSTIETGNQIKQNDSFQVRQISADEQKLKFQIRKTVDGLVSESSVPKLNLNSGTVQQRVLRDAVGLSKTEYNSDWMTIKLIKNNGRDNGQ